MAADSTPVVFSELQPRIRRAVQSLLDHDEIEHVGDREWAEYWLAQPSVSHAQETWLFALATRQGISFKRHQAEA